MNTMERRVHPNCVYKSNPYHECVEACFDKMPQGKPNPPNKKSGNSLNIQLVVPKRLSFKKNENSADVKTLKPDHLTDHLKKSSLDSPSSSSSSASPVQFSFNKVELWNCDIVTTLSHLNTPKLVQRASFLPEESNNIKIRRQQEEEKEEEGILKEFDSMRSTLTVADESIDEESDYGGPADCSRVAIGNYLVKESVSGILPSILNKYGDIAERCKLESVALRSYYLECVCFIILELLELPVVKLRETNKFKEMLSIVKDAGCVGIDVGWLSPVVVRIEKLMELIKQREAFQEEKRDFDANVVECVRKELQVQLQDLAEKEEAASMARAGVEEIQGRLREMEEEECFNMRERMTLIQSSSNLLVDYKSMLTQML